MVTEDLSLMLRYVTRCVVVFFVYSRYTHLATILHDVESCGGGKCLVNLILNIPK